jgi:IS1 family transposase
VGCARFHDRLLRNLSPAEIQMDEIWSFVAKKEARVDRVTDPEDWGDAYTWVALDPHSKLVIAYYTGKRDAAAAQIFVRDLRSRVLTRAHITSDGLVAYIDAMKAAFGRHGVDYGQVVKNYGSDARRDDDHRYEPPRDPFITKIPIFGHPDESRMSTSLVERQNMRMRMHMRRLTRLTNAFSKALRPMRAAVALHFCWYNFCRVHETLRVTPAMESGLADHVWTMEELVTVALAEPVAAPAPSPVPPPSAGGPLGEQLSLFGESTPAQMRPVLRLIKGGKASAANDVPEEAPGTVRGTGWAHLEEGSEGVG